MTASKLPLNFIRALTNVTSAEVASEKEKVKSLQDELDKKVSELAEKNNEIQRVITEKDITVQAANEEKQTLQNDLDAAEQLNSNVRRQLLDTRDDWVMAEQRASAAEEKVTQLEQRLAESFGGKEKQGSVNTEELKTLLNSIVYNVKIAHDDNDKQANKIALDDSTLESTLTKVFGNILKPEMSQNTTEQSQEHWALESTLQTVKGVLDNIYTNTTKIDTVKSSNVDAIEGTALDGRLTEIKTVLESINSKIAKGGTIITKDALKAARTEIKETPKTQVGRATDIKSLTKDYERLGKLRAQFEKDGNLETMAALKKRENPLV